jgi:beta-mannosidase
MFIVYLLLCASVSCISKINLNGRWDFCNSSGVVYPADVPSTLHLDLMNNGLIPDPYFGDNLLSCYIENETWWYNRTFLADNAVLTSKYKYLVFEGLDTHCNVYLNGKQVLLANNMFRKWRIPVNLTASNTISILFRSNAEYDLEAQEIMKNATGIEMPANYSFSRKAAYQYGWDWGPRLLTLGIWKDAYV